MVFVRPIIEYGSTVWNPYLLQDIRSIESVQRSFTEKICNRCKIPFTSYKHRLSMLGIYSLEYRRLEADLIMTFKIVHRLIDLPFEQFFELYSSQYNTRRHSLCLRINRTTTNFQNNSFANRVVKEWNKLPEEMVRSNSLDKFKSQLKKFDLYTVSQLVF